MQSATRRDAIGYGAERGATVLAVLRDAIQATSVGGSLRPIEADAAGNQGVEHACPPDRPPL